MSTPCARVVRHTAVLATLAACGPRPPALPIAVPVVAGAPESATWGAWRTLRAEHHATVFTAAKSGGSIERRTLHGVVAVERPTRFRLRALGPGGVTLFDLLYDNGTTNVVRAFRDREDETFARLLASIAGDLGAAYDLQPRTAERSVRLVGTEVIVEEPRRTVRLMEFHETGRGAAPARMSMEDRPGDDGRGGYRVEIQAEGTVLDDALDPALFTL